MRDSTGKFTQMKTAALVEKGRQKGEVDQKNRNEEEKNTSLNN